MPYHFVIKSFQKSLQVILITLKKYLIILDEAKKKKSEPKKIILSATRFSDYGSYINDYDLDNIDDPYWIIE